LKRIKLVAGSCPYLTQAIGAGTDKSLYLWDLSTGGGWAASWVIVWVCLLG